MSAENREPNTGRYYTEDDIVNLADILGSTIRSGSLYGNFAVGTTAAPLRVGAANLEDRHTVHVINLGTEMVYIGFDDLVTVDTGIPIGTNEERAFTIDPNEDIDLFIIAAAATTIRLLEVH